MYRYDIMILSKKYIASLYSFLGLNWNFLSDTVKVVFGGVNEVTFEQHLRMKAGYQEYQSNDRRVELSSLTHSDLSERADLEVEFIAHGQWCNQWFLCNEVSIEIQKYWV